MATFTPPIVLKATPRVDIDAEGRPVPTTSLQRALFKYMRPLDRPVNVYILSDGTVQTDIPVPLADDAVSTCNVPYPILSMDGRTVGPPEGASGGPFGPPVPYDTVFDATSGELVITEFVLSPYLKYWFAGGRPYPGISANLVSILTAAGYAAYLS